MGAKQGKLILATGLMATLAQIGCDKSADSYSMLAASQDFQQVASFAPKKIDILWVIDNSGSMATSQSNLATNFASFIYRFNQNSYDFHMGVVTTDGWEKRFNSSSTKARLRDGVGSTHTGVFVMDRNTPNLSQTFVTNIKQGTNGNGDERAFDSFRYSLQDSFNVGKNFRRSDAFLAVIIVSDEDDFSWNGSSMNDSSVNNPSLFSVASFTSFLDGYTGRVAGQPANYSVSAIAVLDSACKTQLDVDANDRKIGYRYMQLADATGGIKGSLCSNFGSTLQIISDSIIELSATFQLDRAPNLPTLQVIVDGSSVPQDAANGWTYDATTNSVTFHGPSVPSANSRIQIVYDPLTVKE